MTSYLKSFLLATPFFSADLGPAPGEESSPYPSARKVRPLWRLWRQVMGWTPWMWSLFLKYRQGRGKEEGTRLCERHGFEREEDFKKGDGLPEAGCAPVFHVKHPVLWVHSASVGETITALTLVEALASSWPGTFLFTTGTRSGAQTFEQRLQHAAEGSVSRTQEAVPHQEPSNPLPSSSLVGDQPWWQRCHHRYAPVETPQAVKRFLNRWEPCAALWVESEIWPLKVFACDERHIPIVVINGRMSLNSFAAWQRLPKAAQDLFSRLRVCLAQSKEDASRFATLGVPLVKVTPHLKFALSPLPVPLALKQDWQTFLNGRPTWLAASTHPGEEALVARVHLELRQRLPHLFTWIAPRHPERAARIRREIASLVGETAVTDSLEQRTAATEIFIEPHLGTLGLYYALAPVVFMGKSLLHHGGHNPIEPAHFQCALLWGPHMENFEGICAHFHGASIVVKDEESLAHHVERLLTHPTLCARYQEAAHACLQTPSSIVRATCDHIEPLLNKALEQRGYV